ncbi:hypothetical protein RGQ13_00685 [Thalassotalea psychrophila]|uniref:HTH merR-type domain-containing protein n=1 Tax=Thalassotalea psychrophila TaxID=3065647 RepID=A0ABY9TUJ4_9GAMM|nr:hypothetical protein RGQ13_00685 [Colwelliaceae bacterium SQ149]
MTKTFTVSTTHAAHFLATHGKMENWTYKLQDNRRGKSFKAIGIIPTQTRGGKVFYNAEDIKQVAEAVKLNHIAAQPFVKLFH